MNDPATQFHVPDPPDMYAPDESNAPPRWSAIAITGFVLSFLLVLAPLGVLLGIVGIFRTRGRRRRGMGLAIASIPIGIVVSLGVILVSVSAVVGYYTYIDSARIAGVLKTSIVTVDAKADDFYENEVSRRFELAVSRDRFAGWLRSVVKAHGSLTSFDIRRARLIPTSDGGWTWSVVGEFVNGAAEVAITLYPTSLTDMELRDFSVDGISVLTWKSTQDTAPDS